MTTPVLARMRLRRLVLHQTYRRACALRRHQARHTMYGISLPAILVGLLLALAASVMAAQLLLMARAAYAAIAEDTLIGEKGQQALDILTAQIRQAGWSAGGWHAVAIPLTALARCAQAAPGDMPVCTSASALDSDALQIRFSGSGTPADASLPDDTITDCSGQGVAEIRTPNDGMPAGLSLFYVGRADDGEPQLLCRYPARQDNRMRNGQWTSRSLIRGVEHLRLRFGIDDNADGIPDRHLDTAALGPDRAAWHRVTAVQIALVVRAERRSAWGPSPDLLLFRDPAWRYVPREAPARLRKVFTAGVQLRNPPPCAEMPC